MKNVNQASLEEIQVYMCNLPKIYVETLELDRHIFFGIIGHLCDLEQEKIRKKEKDDKKKGIKKIYSPTDVPIELETPTYMVLQYDVIQKYCLQGFPLKYVRYHSGQYRRTLSAAIIIYYEMLKGNKHEFIYNEYDKIFGSLFIKESVREELYAHVIEDVIGCFGQDELNKIRKYPEGYLLENFLEHWKARGKRFDTIGENWIIILDDLGDGYEEQLDKLCDKVGRLARTIEFLDKLETQSHVKCSEGVLIPYNEYHALHEMLLKDPSLKGTLKEKRDKIFTEIVNLRRIY